LPKLDKHIIETLQHERNEDEYRKNYPLLNLMILVRSIAEHDMREWVDEFFEEIDKID